jgi:hypothetical protein
MSLINDDLGQDMRSNEILRKSPKGNGVSVFNGDKNVLRGVT